LSAFHRCCRQRWLPIGGSTRDTLLWTFCDRYIRGGGGLRPVARRIVRYWRGFGGRHTAVLSRFGTERISWSESLDARSGPRMVSRSFSRQIPCSLDGSGSARFALFQPARFRAAHRRVLAPTSVTKPMSTLFVWVVSGVRTYPILSKTTSLPSSTIRKNGGGSTQRRAWRVGL
jgi:hypothetical protein